MKLVDDFHKIMEEHFQEEFDAPGWEMHDTPTMDITFWNELVRIVGSENIKVISGSRMQRNEGVHRVADTFRCTFMISPEGKKRLKDVEEQAEYSIPPKS